MSTVEGENLKFLEDGQVAVDFAFEGAVVIDRSIFLIFVCHGLGLVRRFFAWIRQSSADFDAQRKFNFWTLSVWC